MMVKKYKLTRSRIVFNPKEEVEKLPHKERVTTLEVEACSYKYTGEENINVFNEDALRRVKNGPCGRPPDKKIKDLKIGDVYQGPKNEIIFIGTEYDEHVILEEHKYSILGDRYFKLEEWKKDTWQIISQYKKPRKNKR